MLPFIRIKCNVYTILEAYFWAKFGPNTAIESCYVILSISWLWDGIL